MIYEDEDELGYWTGEPDDLEICNSLLSKFERDCVLCAAINEIEGNPHAAESFRERAGYGLADIA